MTTASGFHADPDAGVCYRTLDFLGFPGYRVGDDGSVWSAWYRAGVGKGVRIGEPWRHLCPVLSKNHCYVTLWCFGRGTRFYVHRLVLEAFVGPCPPGMECCHDPDHDPTNNRAENLRWDTPAGNVSDRVRHGRSARGQHCGSSVLTDQVVLRARDLAKTGEWTVTQLADEFSVDYGTMSRALRGDTWSHLPGKVTITRPYRKAGVSSSV